MTKKKPVMLVIMDGFGCSSIAKDNAVAQADLKVLPKLWKEYPHSYLGASGEDVGLPDGQIGNSEVGHLNIGAGRIVYQAQPGLVTCAPQSRNTSISPSSMACR